MERREVYRFVPLYKEKSKNPGVDDSVVVLEVYFPDFPDAKTKKLDLFTVQQSIKLLELKRQMNNRKLLAHKRSYQEHWQKTFNDIIQKNNDVFKI